MSHKASQIVKSKTGFDIRFSAMASQCTVLLETSDEALASRIADVASAEAFRIERKFSRYAIGNIVHKINHANAETITVDEETSRLLNFSEQLYQLSDGVFDITSGVLRSIWTFDQSNNIPTRQNAKALLARVGWHKVDWQAPNISLGSGMEIDLGGVGKEYAVDIVAEKIMQITNSPALINFGGDMFATRAPARQAWTIGIETESQRPLRIQLKSGGLATSGDANRFLLKDGIRYSHILNAKTGWPIAHAPRSVTVAARSCTDAGMLATLTMAKGKDAESFATQEKLLHWIER